MKRCLSAIAIAWLMPVSFVWPHHGNEFFFVEDYEIPSPFRENVSSSFAWEKYNSLDTFSSETLIMMSLAPRIALSVSGGLGDHGDGWDFNSVTPRLHVQLTPPKWDFPVRVSLSLGYQFAKGAPSVYETVYETVYEEVPCGCQKSKAPQTTTTIIKTTPPTSGGGTGTGGGGTPVCDPLVDVDCIVPPPHAGHDHTTTTPQTVTTVVSSPGTTQSGSGTKTIVRKVKRVQKVDPEPNRSIHNHDDDLWTARLIIEGDFGKTKAIMNLIALSPKGQKAVWGYAAGIRQQVSHGLAVGVEAIGDFDDKGGTHELVLGSYLSPFHSTTFRFGVGFGLTENSSDISLLTGLTCRF